jgi:hypothetical protein
MWLATKLGFYSIVFKPSHLDPDGPPVYIVRSRDREDLSRLLIAAFLKEGSENHPHTQNFVDQNIHSYDKSDYPYRIILEGAEIGKVMETITKSVTYDNFKDEIKKTPSQSRKLHAYNRLWEHLYNEHFDLRPENL